jgi:hypothetical protein
MPANPAIPYQAVPIALHLMARPASDRAPKQTWSAMVGNGIRSSPLPPPQRENSCHHEQHNADSPRRKRQ